MGGRGLELAASARPVFAGGPQTLAFTVPAIAVKGDLLVVLAVRNGAIVAPAGWTQIETALGAASLFLDGWARTVDDDEPAVATWTSATSQELQGQLLLFHVGAPTLVREASDHLAFTATALPDTPEATSAQSQNLLVAVYSAGAAVALTAPTGFTTVDSYDTAIVAPRALLVAYQVAGEVGGGVFVGSGGPLAPGPAAADPAATGRAFSLVLRERPPIVPLELFDPVPGNIGLLPA